MRHDQRLSPLTVWELVVGSTLSQPWSQRFRGRREFSYLEQVSAAELIACAVLAVRENADGHLLLAEWDEAVQEVSHAGSAVLGEDLVRALDSQDTAAAAVEFALEHVDVQRIRRTLDEGQRVEEERRRRVDEELLISAAERRREARAAEGVAEAPAEQEATERATRQREEQLAQREATRRRLAEHKQMEDAALRAYEAAGDASERAQKTREARKGPPVVDFSPHSQPWEHRVDRLRIDHAGKRGGCQRL